MATPAGFCFKKREETRDKGENNRFDSRGKDVPDLIVSTESSVHVQLEGSEVTLSCGGG